MDREIEEGGEQKMVNKSEAIRAALQQEFSPQSLEVIDESDQHIGHAGYQEGGQSHFRVRMIADQFAGKTRVARHRAVHAAIGPTLMAEIHALALELDAP